jgi:hypothetical protein
MARKKQTAKEISDKVAADVLRNGSKHGSVPTHPAMATPTPDPVDYSNYDPEQDGDPGEDQTS